MKLPASTRVGARVLVLAAVALAALAVTWGCTPPGGAGGASPGGGGSASPSATLSPTGTALAAVPVGPGPRGLAIDSRGFLWVAVHDSNTVVKIVDGKASDSISVPSPDALAFDATGDLWVGTDNGIYGFTPDGSALGSTAGPPVEAIAASGSTVFASLPSLQIVRAYAITATSLGGGVNLVSGGGTPHDLLVDPAGRLWVAQGGANQVVRYDPPQTASTVPVQIPCGFDAEGLATDASGSVYVLGNSTIADVSSTPSVQVVQDSRLAGAVRMAIDAKERFWIAGRQTNQVVLISSGASVSVLPTPVFEPYDLILDLTGNPWVTSEGSGQVVEFSGS